MLTGIITVHEQIAQGTIGPYLCQVAGVISAAIPPLNIRRKPRRSLYLAAARRSQERNLEPEFPLFPRIPTRPHAIGRRNPRRNGHRSATSRSNPPICNLRNPCIRRRRCEIRKRGLVCRAHYEKRDRLQASAPRMPQHPNRKPSRTTRRSWKYHFARNAFLHAWQASSKPIRNFCRNPQRMSLAAHTGDVFASRCKFQTAFDRRRRP